jgi:sugar phosphate isomerase/epimerase
MKKITRKEFIGLSMTSALVAPFFIPGSGGKKVPDNLPAQPRETGRYIDDIGFQVFSLRDALINNSGSLFRSLAGAGIRNIEFFNPATLNAYVPIVKDCGMKPLCTHFMPGYITGNWESARKMNMAPPDHYFYENIIEDCTRNGIKYMGVAILLEEDRPTLDDYKRFAEKANKCGEQSKSAGIQLYYHNHSFEFQPMKDTTPYEEMLKIFDRELVKLELDVFWATLGAQDPLQLLQKTADRLLFVHLKDLKKGSSLGVFDFDIPPDSFTELGTGMLDLKSILAKTRELGIRYAIIDQDSTQMEDKIASVKMNCDYIKALGI